MKSDLAIHTTPLQFRKPVAFKAHFGVQSHSYPLRDAVSGTADAGLMD